MNVAVRISVFCTADQQTPDINRYFRIIPLNTGPFVHRISNPTVKNLYLCTRVAFMQPVNIIV